MAERAFKVGRGKTLFLFRQDKRQASQKHIRRTLQPISDHGTMDLAEICLPALVAVTFIQLLPLCVPTDVHILLEMLYRLSDDECNQRYGLIPRHFDADDAL